MNPTHSGCFNDTIIAGEPGPLLTAAEAWNVVEELDQETTARSVTLLQTAPSLNASTPPPVSSET